MGLDVGKRWPWGRAGWCLMAGINYGSKEHIALGAGFAGATMLCVYHPPSPATHIKQSQKISYPSVLSRGLSYTFVSGLLVMISGTNRFPSQGECWDQHLAHTCRQFWDCKASQILVSEFSALSKALRSTWSPAVICSAPAKAGEQPVAAAELLHFLGFVFGRQCYSVLTLIWHHC